MAKKTKCYSVRLKSLETISNKAYKATAFDGSSDIIPASQVYAPDLDVNSSDAWWISAWILEKKSIQYSTKKIAWFEVDDRGHAHFISTSTTISRHVPQKIGAVNNNLIDNLKR